MGHARQLTVGAALSLSGPFSPQGWQAYRGLALWTEDVNRAGGLLAPRLGARLPLALRVEDDQGRAERVAALTERLILANQVDLLIGPYSSTLVLAAAAVAERHRRVLWNHGGSSDAISQRGFRWVVPLATPASRYFHGLLDLVERLVPAPRRVALVHGARGTFPRAAIDGAEAHARQRRFTVVARLEYPAAEADLPALIDRLAAAQPDIVLAAGRTEVDLAFARRLRAAGNVAPVVGLVAAALPLFGQTLGRDAHGYFGPSQWEPGLGIQPDVGPTAAEFARRFEARFQTGPDYVAAQAYAAGLVAQRCVQLAGTTQDEALRDAARALTLTTLYGDFRLDPATGEQIGHRLLTIQWQGDSRVIVWPPEHAQAQPVLGRPAPG